MRHVPALDGLRGLALLGVLFFHANGALPGGYLGVDLFFVLSGYLITSLLLAEQRETGRIALSNFWVRRARRLFPALLSLMPAVAIYARYFARTEELQPLRAQALAALAYVANWQTILAHRSYWQLFAAPSPLEHTWSLSIEEQFYVLWPLLVTYLLKRFSSRALLGVSLVLSALSMAAMFFLFTPENSTRAYLGTDTRMAGILLGAALATLISPSQTFRARTVRWLDGLGALSLLGLGFAWYKLRGGNPFLYHGGFWLTELGALVLIVCAVAGPQSYVARVLALRPLTLLGTISYGVYLWHWPVNVCMTAQRVHVHGLALYALRFAVTFAIAIASYWCLERPIRRNGVPFNRPLLVVPAAILLSVFLVVHATYAGEGRASSAPSTFAQVSAFPEEDVRYRVLLFGDSTANSLGWGLRSLHEEGVGIELLGKDGCNMLTTSACEAAHWGEQVRKLHPNVSLVYLAGAFLYGFSVQGSWHTACRPDWNAQFKTALSKGLTDLRREPGDVYVSTIPYPLGPYEDEPEMHERAVCINTLIRKVAGAVPGVRLLDVGNHLCPNGVCQQDIGLKEPIRPDGVHFDIESAHDVSRWVYEQLRR